MSDNEYENESFDEQDINEDELNIDADQIDEEPQEEVVLDDIELLPEELFAYQNLLKAKQKIHAMNAPEEEKGSVAKAILPSNDKVYKEKEILEILEEIKDDSKSWPDTLALTAKTKLAIENFEDDLNRELEFYQQTMETVEKARERMIKHKIPILRPDDFFAEMIKSDAQMAKIKSNLLQTKQQIESKEQSRARREQRKYGRQIQEEKLKEKIQKKKQNLEAIKSWKKSQKGKETYDIDVLEDNIKTMEDNGIQKAEMFDQFQKKKNQGKSNKKLNGKMKATSKKERDVERKSKRKMGVPKTGGNKKRPGKQVRGKK